MTGTLKNQSQLTLTEKKYVYVSRYITTVVLEKFPSALDPTKKKFLATASRVWNLEKISSVLYRHRKKIVYSYKPTVLLWFTGLETIFRYYVNV